MFLVSNVFDTKFVKICCFDIGHLHANMRHLNVNNNLDKSYLKNSQYSKE